MTGITWTRSYI